MSLNYTNKWEEVENTVKDRILDDSLLHTLSPDKKIKKRTKFTNQQLKKTRNNLRSYKQFLSVRRKVERRCQSDGETDDEPPLSHEAYKKIYNRQPKCQLQKFLRLCTRTRKREYPEKNKGKLSSYDTEKSSKTQAVKHPDYRTISKAVKSVKTTVPNFNNVQSKLSETQSQLFQRRLLNRRIIRSSDEENVEQSNLPKDNNIDEKNVVQKIVQDLISSHVEKPSADALLTSNLETVELTNVRDNAIVKNLSDELPNSEEEYANDAKAGSKTCLELEKDSIISNDGKQESFNVISDVTEDPDVSDLVLNNKEIFKKDNLLSQEDIFMSNGLEKNLDNENNSEEDIDSLDHDSGNNSLSDADVSKMEHGESSNDNAAGFVIEHCSSVNNENNIVLDNVFQREENKIKSNRLARDVSLDNELKKNVKLSSGNLDNERSEENQLTKRIGNLKSNAELSTENTANEKRNKLKIRAIERYDKGFDIFCKHQLHTEKGFKTVNDLTNESTNNELISEDEQPLESRKLSQGCHSPRKELQRRLTDYENSIEVKSTGNKLPSENEQPITLQKPSKNSNLFENESQHLNWVVDDEYTSPLAKSSPGKFNSSANQSLLDTEKQTKGNTSYEENSTTEISSHRLDRSSSSSFSSFTARSCDEDVKNSVKTQLLSEIEQRLKFPAPTKRKNSSNATGHCSLENTPRSSKIPRPDKASTKRQLESISCEPKSREAISHELQQKNNTDNSHNREKQELSESAYRAPKRKPRPKNLEDFVAMEELTRDTTKPHFRLKDISDEDEIWIMDIPKTINPKDLENRIILLGEKSQLTFGDDCYKVSSKPAKDICNVSCIFATSRRKKQYKIENVVSKGTIKFRQQLFATPKTKPIPSEIAAVPFPKRLKRRHPLFGANYKDKI